MRTPRSAAAVIALGIAVAPWASRAAVFTASGTVFNDLNGDHSSDGGADPGIAGWTVDLLDNMNTVVATTTTGVTGNYQFQLLALGSFTVKAILPSGWIGTLPAGGSYAISTTQDFTGLDFGNFGLVSVSGSIYDDVNGSGSANPGEPGLAGRTAEVLDSGNNLVASAISDASGNYSVNDVGPGTFTLHVLPLPGETITQPTSPDFYSFASSSGVDVVGGIFGLTGVTPAPEPMSLSIFGIAMLGLGAVRRLRR